MNYYFSEIAEFRKGVNYSSLDYTDEYAGIPFISIKCLLKGGGFDLSGIKFLKDRFDDTDKLTSGDLLFSITDLTRDGDIVGSPMLIPKQYQGSVASMDLIRVIVNPQLADTEYLYNLMMTREVRGYFVNHSAGSTVLHLEIASIPKLVLNLPKLLAQRKIALILRTADAVIEKTLVAISKYKAIKQGMLHDLFTRGIDLHTGTLRPKSTDMPKLYQDSPLGKVPKDWNSYKMGKHIIENLYGPRFSAKNYAETGNVKTIRGTDFSKDGEILYKQTPIALLPLPLVNAHRLKNGDVVIVTTADCGLTAVFQQPKNDVDFIPSAYSVKYRFDETVNPYFIKYFMATNAAIRQVNKFVRQGTLGNLPGSDFLRFDMIFPEKDEQDLIAQRLINIDSKIQTEQNYLAKLQSIKAGMMADLLSGKKPVKVEDAKLT